MSKSLVEKRSYSALAEIYDEVMADVDYETWADYIDEIILEHNPEAEDLLELACGTGTIALSLEELDCYNITATDGSPDMIEQAIRKGKKVHSEIHFETMNFLDIQLPGKFDVVYMVFDSINYLHSEEEILQLYSQVKQVLKPDGIFIFDFTTPRNSRKAIQFLHNHQKEISDEIRYYRKSSFDGKNSIHKNHFRIVKTDTADKSKSIIAEEIHKQKIYTQQEMEAIIKKTDFTILQAYDGFELRPAHEKSLRITMVLK